MIDQVPQSVTWMGIIALVVMNAFAIVREQIRHKSVKKQNGSVDEIKDVIKRVDTKIDSMGVKVESNKLEVARIGVGIEGLKLNCHSTTERFEKAILDNQNRVIDLIKEKGK